jgi:c-di-GMP-binding flagellar brake protein YcgR
MDAMTKAEKRSHERRAMRSPVEVLLPGRAALAMRATDISVGGIGLVAAANAPLGLEVQLRIPLPFGASGTQHFEVRARVQHSVFSSRDDGFRIGMVFLRPSDRLVVAIGDFLAR